MTKLFWNVLKFSPVVFAATFVGTSAALAGEANQQVNSVSQLTQASKTQEIGQVTSVSQFSDVQPTDWAFQALQSLVERYGCIAGYPNSTFRGNRALTRYEFAAGLNACLDRVNELIATATADLVTKQDLATLQRLQEEFSAELATLRGRVDALEARTAELEANQFSTTTKLSGEVIFSVAQAFGDRISASGRAGAPATGFTGANNNPNTRLDSNMVFSDRVRLSLNTSFTGTDQLQTRLQAGNIIPNNATTIGNATTGTNMTRLGHDVSAPNANEITIDKLNYAFNLSDSVRIKIDATGAELNENTNVFSPDFRSSGSGALSRYGRFSPIYRQANDGAGITVNLNPNGPLTFTAAYMATGRNASANPAPGSGLFEGNNTLFGQIAFKPNPAFNLGLTYARTYQQTPSLFGSTGSANANNPFNNAKTEANNYGIQATFQPSAKLTFGGWVGYTSASTLDGSRRDADIWYWAASLGLKDFGREGNTLGIIFGQPPKVSGVGNPNNIATTGRDTGTSYHLEGLYKIKLSDNILVTPGLLVIFNPENNDKNDTVYVGTLRTTFTF